MDDNTIMTGKDVFSVNGSRYNNGEIWPLVISS